MLRVKMIDDKHGVQRTNNEMIDVPEKKYVTHRNKQKSER